VSSEYEFILQEERVIVPSWSNSKDKNWDKLDQNMQKAITLSNKKAKNSKDSSSPISKLRPWIDSDLSSE